MLGSLSLLSAALVGDSRTAAAAEPEQMLEYRGPATSTA